MAEGVARTQGSPETSVSGQGSIGDLLKALGGDAGKTSFTFRGKTFKDVSPQFIDEFNQMHQMLMNVKNTTQRTGAILPLSDDIYARIREMQGYAAGDTPGNLSGGMRPSEIQAWKHLLATEKIPLVPSKDDFGPYSMGRLTELLQNKKTK